jgi:plasmid stabilization system protein ParE
MKQIFHPLFKVDLDDATDYHNDQREGLGDELREEVERTVAKIARSPERYSKTYGEVRRARLQRFKFYAVRFQLLEDGTIYYLSVLHGARHPDIGKGRS